MKPKVKNQPSAAAYLHAEGAMWLATGETHLDDTHPMASILKQLEQAVPVLDRYDWLNAPREEFDGRSAFDLIDAEELDPLATLLDSLVRWSNGAAAHARA